MNAPGTATQHTIGSDSFDDDERRHVLQGVHRVPELKPAAAWGRDAPTSKFAFIGRGLVRRSTA